MSIIDEIREVFKILFPKGINEGEDQAIRFLKRNGYTILDTNYKQKMGEIDIIAKNGNVLVFVEVKMRIRTDFGTPAQSVTPKKQFRIKNVAHIYIKNNKIKSELRFDVIEVFSKTGEINHIMNAF